MKSGEDQESIPMTEENPFTSIPIEVVVSVGTARPLVRDLVNLEENSILYLDRTVTDPVDLFVGDQLIARGELEELDGDKTGKLVVRLTQIALPVQAS